MARPSQSTDESSRTRLTVEASARVEKLSRLLGVPEADVVTRALELLERELPIAAGGSVPALSHAVDNLARLGAQREGDLQQLALEVNRLERAVALHSLSRIVSSS